MTVQAGLGERQKSSQVGSSAVRQIQSRWITQTAKGRYNRKKKYCTTLILYKCKPPVCALLGHLQNSSINFLKQWYKCCHFSPYIKLSPVTYFRKTTYTCFSLEDIWSFQEKSLIPFNSARLSIILKSCVLILHTTESDSKSGTWGFKQFA